MSFQARKNYRSELKEIDWDFTGAHGNEGFAAYHWYPARYVPQLPGILINYFSGPGDLVLDPFCGSATTLIEAFKFGRRAIGIDLHPIAVLIAQAKLTNYDEASFLLYLTEIVNQASILTSDASLLRSKDEKQLITPHFEQNSLWYAQDTLHELACIWTVLQTNKDSIYLPVGQAAFSAILRGCCSQQKHWGWICDNVKPSELAYRPALSRFKDKLQEFRITASNLHTEAAELQETSLPVSEIRVVQGDCREALQQYQEQTVDLVVTSPPYFSMTDYMNSQRLSLLWFENDLEELRPKEIGARYKRFRKDPLTEYLRNMKEAFQEIQRVLKEGHYCCVVIGESPMHKPFLGALEQVWQEIGLQLEDCLSRKIAKKRSLSPVLYDESIYILKRVSHE